MIDMAVIWSIRIASTHCRARDCDRRSASPGRPVVRDRRRGHQRPWPNPAKLARRSRESLIYVETPWGRCPPARDLLEALQATLADVHARGQRHWPAMQPAMSAGMRRLPQASIDEAPALIGWLGGGMLTQLDISPVKPHLAMLARRRCSAICRGSAREIAGPRPRSNAGLTNCSNPARESRRQARATLLVIMSNVQASSTVAAPRTVHGAAREKGRINRRF